MALTSHDWFFMAWFFTLWFILSFFMVMLYCIWEEKKKNSYDGELFTVKDIFIMILFAPFTIVCGILYLIMWFVMRVLHFEDIVDAMSNFMNKPIGRKRK